MIKHAYEFFKDIQHEKAKYKLVNGIFIVKFDNANKDVCSYVGEFRGRTHSLNKGHPPEVIISESALPQIFNPKKGLYASYFSDGYHWKPLTIKFRMSDIKDILQ